MAQKLKIWLDTEVALVKGQTTKWLSQYYFHRVEMRGKIIDSSVIFTPADGVVMDAHDSIKSNENILDIKGVHLSLRDLMQDEDLRGSFTVVSVFMTFYSQHQNYIPYPGYRTYLELPPIDTFNKPMLKVEKELLEGVINPAFQEPYLRKNSREISTIVSPKLGQDYYIIRIGDYDVDTMVNWSQPVGEESASYQQNDRFGMITYGSACILVIPHIKGGAKFKLREEATPGMYVKCCYDALVDIIN